MQSGIESPRPKMPLSRARSSSVSELELQRRLNTQPANFPPQGPPKIKRHEEYYFEDGSLVIQVGLLLSVSFLHMSDYCSRSRTSYSGCSVQA